jgi:16S rRNA (guanine527-N7)-methyltransferase
LEIIQKYFPELSTKQMELYSRLSDLYTHWNEQINVLSRKDIDQLYERHVLHSLAIAKFIQFKPDTRIMDVGTGGGFPGIPLAIMFPECRFTLVDSIAKKIKVVNEVAKELQLKNVEAFQERAEKVNDKFHFVVSRAVTAMPRFVPWVRNSFRKANPGPLPNGIIGLKGGDLTEELKPFAKRAQIIPITDYFQEEFFETKKIVYIRAQ